MGDDNRLAEAHYRRGHYLGVLSRHEEAVEALDAALAAAQRAQNLRTEANALSVKVFILTRMGRMSDAREIAGKALACAEALDEPEILGRTLSNVSVYFAAAGDLGRAAELLQRQAEMLDRAGNRLGQVNCLANLGYYYLLLGLYRMAKASLERAQSLAETIGARRERMYNQLNLGLVCWRMGDGATARHLLQGAIPQLAGLGDTFGQAAGTAYLGLANWRRRTRARRRQRSKRRMPR
jgi:tetratricopeptide (TPR) repeat protein